jgi:hypothetical protein
MLQDSTIANMPWLTAVDLRHTQEFYGNPLEYMRAKSMKRKVSRAVVEDDLVLNEKE